MQNLGPSTLRDIDKACHQSLIDKIASGDSHSLERLYEMYVDKVYTLAYRILKNESDAEDITCEVFIEVWDKASTYCPARGSVLSWLLIKCRCRAIDLLRAHKRRSDKHASIQNDIYPTHDFPPGPENFTMLFQDTSRLKSAMMHLTDNQRQAIFLSYYQGHSHQEISNILGIPLGTVKSHINRGFKTISEQLTTEAIL